MTLTVYSLDQAAERLHKSRRWLHGWLRKYPTDADGEAFYFKAGRTFLFKDDGIERVQRTLARQERKVSQRTVDAHRLLPTARLQDGGTVYFVRGGDLIKIGYTKKWRGRLSNLQTASPEKLSLLHLEPGDREKEKALHRLFEHLHSHREWFHAGTDLLSYIDLLRGGR